MSYKYKKDSTSKHVFLVCTAFVCFLIASSVLPFVSDAKGLPTPDILLCFVCILPAFTDIKKAGVYALALGFLSDLFVTLPLNLSPVVYLACVYIAAKCHTYFARVGSLALAISTLPCIVLKLAAGAAVSLLTVDGANMSGFSVSSAVFTMAGGFAMAIALSFVMRLIYKKLKI